EYVIPRNPSGRDQPLTFSGINASTSPDGRSLAFIGGPSGDLVVRNLDTGQERTYPHAVTRRSTPPRWFHDGSSVIVVTKEGDASSGEVFSRVDLQAGTFQPLVARSTNGQV